MEILEQDIGGARVRRTFTNNGRQMKAGDSLKADEVIKFPRANRIALVDAGFIEIYPKAAGSAIEGAERFIVGNGKHHYDVIHGVKLNEQPLTKAQADEMANT